MIIRSDDPVGNNMVLDLVSDNIVTSAEQYENIIIIKLGSGESLKIEPVDDLSVVYLEDIAGDLQDLVGYPLVQREVVFNDGGKPDPSTFHETSTWTYTKLGGLGGYVTLRYYGASNGYYTEGVCITYDDGKPDLLPDGERKEDIVSGYSPRLGYNYHRKH